MPESEAEQAAGSLKTVYRGIPGQERAKIDRLFAAMTVSAIAIQLAAVVKFFGTLVTVALNSFQFIRGPFGSDTCRPIDLNQGHGQSRPDKVESSPIVGSG